MAAGQRAVRGQGGSEAPAEQLFLGLLPQGDIAGETLELSWVTGHMSGDYSPEPGKSK